MIAFHQHIFRTKKKKKFFFFPFNNHLKINFPTELLSLNTTSGSFRKLGRLYESCLRQQINSSTIRLTMERLGGFLPIHAIGPLSVTPLLVKMMNLGAPLPLLDIYYDLSYGRKPQVLLIIDVPTNVHNILLVSHLVN